MQITESGCGRRWGWMIWPAALALLGLWAGGCSSSKNQVDPTREPAQMLLPRLTDAVTGPAAGLLTNLDGFDGQFTIDFGSTGVDELTATGEVHERGGLLCFEPVFKTLNRKGIGAGAFTVIWDAAGRRGYVLSDALQGFAPVVPQVESTNTTAAGDSGKATELRVDRADHLNGLAVRIQSLDAEQPFTLTLSGVKPGLPPPEIFVPPDGFTRYDSEGAMLSELATRARTVMGIGRRDEGALGPYKSEPGAQRPRDDNNPGYSTPGY